MKGDSYVKYFTALATLAFAYFYVYPNQSPKVTPVIQVLEKVRGHFQIHPAAASLAERYANGCPEHHFDSVRQLSRSPDIMIIDGFLTPEEAQILVKAADPLFEESQVIDQGDITKLDKSHRDSQTAFLPIPPKDPQSLEEKVISCVEQRAVNFQGHVPVKHLENLQCVKYGATQKFNPHFDWLFGDSLDRSGNRATSFFVYLVANCTGGTTVFPKVTRPHSEEWCTHLKCSGDDGEEVPWVEVQAKEGTAVFWHNLDPDGNTDDRTLHAGAPVVAGTKIGLNIWTRESPFRTWDDPPAEEEQQGEQPQEEEEVVYAQETGEEAVYVQQTEQVFPRETGVEV